MRQGIAVAGNLNVDYVKIIDSYPKQGNLSSILSNDKSVGGAVPNVALDLSKIDRSIPLSAIGVVGQDEDGQYLIDLLEEYGIETCLINRNTTLGTSFTDVMTVQSTGARTFLHYRGANGSFNPEHFDFTQITSKMLHIGYALLLDGLDKEDDQYGTAMARVLFTAQKHGIKTSLDAVSENSNRFTKIVPPSLKYCNYFIVNELESSLTTDIPVRDIDENLIVGNIKKICAKLFCMGVNDLVVIHAPEGGFAMDANGNFYTQPSLKLPQGYIKGTVGAGDAFCAGILYSIYNNWTIEKALQVAVGAAACCLSHANCTSGMKDIGKIQELFELTEKQELTIDL